MLSYSSEGCNYICNPSICNDIICFQHKPTFFFCVKMNNLLMLWERKPSVRAHLHILLYSPLRKKKKRFLNFWRLCLKHPRQISRPYFGNFGQERGWEMSSSCRMGGTQWGSFSGYVLDSWPLNRDGNCSHWGVCEPCGFLSPTPGGDQGGVFGLHSSSSSQSSQQEWCE